MLLQRRCDCGSAGYEVWFDTVQSRLVTVCHACGKFGEEVKKRRERSGRPRHEGQKPWEAEGIGQRWWYRKQALARQKAEQT